MKVPIIRFGRYTGYPIESVPLDYLYWILPKLRNIKTGKIGDPGRAHVGNAWILYEQILNYLLSKDVRVVCKLRQHNGHCFYLNTFKKYLPSGEEMPFLRCDWRAKNSKGDYVYETEAHGVRLYIVHEGGRYHLSKNYVSHSYPWKGQTMVYEKNPEFYFVDVFGRTIQGAFLLRKPYVPESSKVGTFSENKRIEELKTNVNELQ